MFVWTAFLPINGPFRLRYLHVFARGAEAALRAEGFRRAGDEKFCRARLGF